MRTVRVVASLVFALGCCGTAGSETFKPRGEFEVGAAVDALEEVAGDAETAPVVRDTARSIIATLKAGDPNARSAAAAGRIVNGTLTAGFPTTVAILKGGDPAEATNFCSGTIIGCSTVQSAGHCFKGGTDADHYTVFSAHAGFFAIDEISIHEDYPESRPFADLAVVRLARPVEGIVPTPLNTLRTPPDGTFGTIAGYGRSGGLNFDYGLKRYGAIRTTRCLRAGAGDKLLCWNYDNVVGLPGEDSNTCNSDSGGPTFVLMDGVAVLGAVTTGGKPRSQCINDDHAHNANVFAFHAWIEAAAGEPLGDNLCGAGPEVDDIQAPVFGASTFVTEGSSEAVDFDVPANATRFHLAMNGHDDLTGGTDFNLEVISEGSGAPACLAEGSGQFAFCRVDGPTAGRWTAVVHGVKGEGVVQLTLTTFLE